jgi:hypothetical protein
MQVELVNTEQENNVNEMIFDDTSALLGFKLPSIFGIHRVFIQRHPEVVRQQVEQFDSDFLACARSISTDGEAPDLLADCHRDALRQIEEELAGLPYVGGHAGADVQDVSVPEEVELYAEALHFAITAHNSIGQTREDNHTPYWIHVVRVVERLRRAISAPSLQLLIAALLHDVVEDCGVSVGELSDRFGEVTADIVAAVSRGATQSFDEYLDQIAQGPPDGRILKLADRWDNVTELSARRYATYGEMPPMEYLLQSGELLSTCRDAHPILAQLLEIEVDRARVIFADSSDGL